MRRHSNTNTPEIALIILSHRKKSNRVCVSVFLRPRVCELSLHRAVCRRKPDRRRWQNLLLLHWGGQRVRPLHQSQSAQGGTSLQGNPTPNVLIESLIDWPIDRLIWIHCLAYLSSSRLFSLTWEGWRLCSDVGPPSSRPSWCVRTNPAVSATTSWPMFSPRNTHQATPAARTSTDCSPPSGKLRNKQGWKENQSFSLSKDIDLLISPFILNIFRNELLMRLFPSKSSDVVA